MPAVSEKQKKFMQAVAHNKAFAKKVGVPQKVGKEFAMKKYAKGGISEYGGMEKYSSKAAMKKHEAAETPKEEKLEKKMGKNMARATMQKVASTAVKRHEKAMHGAKKMAKGGKIDGCAKRGKTKGRMI